MDTLFTHTKKALLLLALAAGCDAPGDVTAAATAADDEAIQGGAADRGDPAVGLVWIASGGFCTGSLIAPDVVLTAGHCVEEQVSAFYTGAGKASANVREPGSGFTAHAVVDQVAHPSYRSRNVCPNPTYDVALLKLAEPIDSVKPLALASAAPAVGTACRAVGYGVHNSGSRVTVEQRRSATETVAGVVKSAIHVARKSGIVDHGDSGGPLLCGGKIAGTTSCGNGADDPSHTDAWYGRVDGIRSWIDEAIAGWN